MLTASIAAGFTGCGATDSGKQTVYVIMMVENGAFVDMKDGFTRELRDKGYAEDKLEVVYKCAQGDATNLNTIV